jgi:hypothetical protein
VEGRGKGGTEPREEGSEGGREGRRKAEKPLTKQ